MKKYYLLILIFANLYSCSLLNKNEDDSKALYLMEKEIIYEKNSSYELDLSKTGEYIGGRIEEFGGFDVFIPSNEKIIIHENTSYENDNYRNLLNIKSSEIEFRFYAEKAGKIELVAGTLDDNVTFNLNNGTECIISKYDTYILEFDFQGIYVANFNHIDKSSTKINVDILSMKIFYKVS